MARSVSRIIKDSRICGYFNKGEERKRCWKIKNLDEFDGDEKRREGVEESIFRIFSGILCIRTTCFHRVIQWRLQFRLDTSLSFLDHHAR